MSTGFSLRYKLGPLIVLGLLVAMLVFALAYYGGAKGGLAASAIGGTYLYLTIRTGKRRLKLDDDGITDTGTLSGTSIRWDEVERYTFFSMNQQYAGAGAGGGGLVVILVLLVARAMRKTSANRAFGMGRMRVYARDGRRVSITPSWDGADDALDRAFAELHPRLLASSDPAVLFAPFVVSDHHITHATKGEIALPDVESIKAGNATIKIRKRGKRLAWLSIGMRRVNNPMLFLEKLAERGLVVNAADDVFLPPPILAKLLEAQNRAAALPTAKVVQR